MNEIADRMRRAIEGSGLSYREIAAMTGVSKSTLQRYASGITDKIPLRIVTAVAKATKKKASYLMGWEPDMPPGLEPVRTKLVPLIGEIACGEPILAVENIEGYVPAPEDVACDYVLRCKGDSMIGARINDGDLVYIKEQPDVENGEIAAILIDDEVTLKRVYKTGETIVLQAENPIYPPRILTALSGDVRILGRAVGFYSDIK